MEYIYHKDITRFFLHQTDADSCGPIALVNAYLWCMGNKTDETTYAKNKYVLNKIIDLSAFRFQLSTNTSDGTYPEKMTDIVKRYMPNCIYVDDESAFNNYLDMGYGLILIFSTSRTGGHYVFVFKENNKYHVVNNQEAVESYNTYGHLKKSLFRPRINTIYYEKVNRTYKTPIGWVIIPNYI